MTSTKQLVAAVALTAVTISAPMAPASAEERTYGAVELTGLARNSWHLNPAGESNAMVCNVNGPDGWVAIRSGPGTGYAARRKLKRLAVLVVDTSQRQGRWVRVTTAYRTFTPDGDRQRRKTLHVSGWAHDGYLCDFLD